MRRRTTTSPSPQPLLASASQQQTKIIFKSEQPPNEGPQAMDLRTGQMTGGHSCSEGHERRTAMTRRRDTPLGASMQNSTSRAGRVASPAEQRGKTALAAQ
ncbi:hypothetical protein TcCL_NonESM02062 [Trypanosoma cruzi]|nr:hypothetical protein TcCL_NonESM02062 [Trypanosoma cruzi]